MERHDRRSLQGTRPGGYKRGAKGERRKIKGIIPKFEQETANDIFSVPGDWRFDAACSPETADLFEGSRKAAKEICAGCPVARECLEFSLRVNDDKGDGHMVWAGLSRDQRRRVRRALTGLDGDARVDAVDAIIAKMRAENAPS